MTFNCMYGEAHPGDHVAVRSKIGTTIGWLCRQHHALNETNLLKGGYHFRTAEELAARGEGNGGKNQSPSAATSVDKDTTPQQQQPVDEHSSGDQESAIAAPERHTAGHAGGQPHGSAQAGRLADDGRQSPAGDAGDQAQELETVTSRETASARGLPHPATRPQGLVAPEWPQWAEGAGHLTLTQTQRDILQNPFRDDEITIRYDGVVYAPWRRYWSRMIEAFAPAVPAIIPIDNPRFQGTEIVVGVVMVVEGKFIGKAWGSHRLEGENDRMSVGDRIESAISDAISKIGKRLNMGEDLWDDSYRDYWKSQFAESYSNGKRTYWRRRPMGKVEEHE